MRDNTVAAIFGILFIVALVVFIAWAAGSEGQHQDRRAIDRAAVLLIESDIDAETRRAGVAALSELLRVRRETP